MAAWGYGLLGPVEVRVDGRAVPLPGARQRLVLTMLLVDVNRVVPAEHPEREQARRLFMQALYRAGRHTEALATFRSWRRYLATELGLDPSPALRRIEQDILRHTAKTPDIREAAVTRAPSLPLPVTSFVGRDEDLMAVAARLDRARLLTLHGRGGVGKTRLALEVAERTGDSYRDGVCFCDLAAVTEPHAVVRALATAAGLSERAFQRLDDQLVEQLADRHLLLVLDNCEHVAQAAAILAERLLKQTRNVTLLATSRERLEVDGEHVWQVRPLPVSGLGAPAVRLFLDRARAADPAAAPRNSDVEAVAAVCQAGRPAARHRAGRRAAARDHGQRTRREPGRQVRTTHRRTTGR
jgi:hypothetical protein